MIAALFTERNGPYFGLSTIDPWWGVTHGDGRMTVGRDARKYRGPHRVIAHPPCARWGKLWWGGPSSKIRHKLGDDGGCFKAALDAVRQWGGVIEHPAHSHAWEWFGLQTPPHAGGWVRADDCGWTCHVEQGHYGHLAPKPTWLYAVGEKPPDLVWGRSNLAPVIGNAGSRGGKHGQLSKTTTAWMSKKARKLTPGCFREVLIEIALGSNAAPEPPAPPQPPALPA